MSLGKVVKKMEDDLRTIKREVENKQRVIAEKKQMLVKRKEKIAALREELDVSKKTHQQHLTTVTILEENIDSRKVDIMKGNTRIADKKKQNMTLAEELSAKKTEMDSENKKMEDLLKVKKAAYQAFPKAQELAELAKERARLQNLLRVLKMKDAGPPKFAPLPQEIPSSVVSTRNIEDVPGGHEATFHEKPAPVEEQGDLEKVEVLVETPGPQVDSVEMPPQQDGEKEVAAVNSSGVHLVEAPHNVQRELPKDGKIEVSDLTTKDRPSTGQQAASFSRSTSQSALKVPVEPNPAAEDRHQPVHSFSNPTHSVLGRASSSRTEPRTSSSRTESMPPPKRSRSRSGMPPPSAKRVDFKLPSVSATGSRSNSSQEWGGFPDFNAPRGHSDSPELRFPFRLGSPASNEGCDSGSLNAFFGGFGAPSSEKPQPNGRSGLLF